MKGERHVALIDVEEMNKKGITGSKFNFPEFMQNMECVKPYEERMDKGNGKRAS